MRINFDRLSQLAGISGGSSRRSLNESAHYEGDHNDEPMMEDDYAMEAEEEGEISEYNMFEAEEEPTDEDDAMLDVDEAMLVQELRRAKRIMQENKRCKQLAESRQRRRKQQIFENQVKRIIDEEVQNVFDEMNYSNGWVYGNNKPRRSRNGYTHQGSFIPGIGFRR
jgi:uncharacterized protein with von Willebrand factor type A (vWA) domain